MKHQEQASRIYAPHSCRRVSCAYWHLRSTHLRMLQARLLRNAHLGLQACNRNGLRGLYLHAVQAGNLISRSEPNNPTNTSSLRALQSSSFRNETLPLTAVTNRVIEKTRRRVIKTQFTAEHQKRDRVSFHGSLFW
jgi:hypothetical protein